MATKTWITVSLGALLSNGACGSERDRYPGDNYCQDTHTECHLSYSAWSGYQRYCSRSNSTCAPGQGVASHLPAAAADAGARASAGGAARAPEAGAAPLPEAQRYSAFDIACQRDSQCGSGRCIEGACYYGCQSDSQCGTGDRCAVEQGARICMPDPNPPVQCTRSAQCGASHACLNGTCVQSCMTTEQCSNLVDRCASGICQPDRRPLGQCVLSSECAAGFACLDGACVAACAEAGDAGVCLPGSGAVSTVAPGGQRPEQPPAVIPLASGDAGSSASPPAAAPEPALDAGVPSAPGELPTGAEPDAGSFGAEE